MVQRLPPSREITQDDRDDLLIPLVSGIQELVFAPVSPFNDRPAFVAGPRPETGLAGAVYDITRLNCRLWASKDKSNYSNRVNQGNAEICGPYLDQIGENPEGGFAGPEFEGGQCAIDYFVNGVQTSYAVDGSVDAEGPWQIAARGPIGGLSFTNSGFGPVLGPLAGPARGFFAVLSSASGPQLAFGNGNGGVKGSIVSVVPQAAVPDDCGDPDPVIQPPGTVVPVTPIVPTINIDLPGIGPIDITVDVDVTGNPVVIAPELGIEATVAPEVNIGGGGGDGGGGTPPLDPEIGPPIDSPPGGGGGGNDTGFGEPPEGRIWVGAYVQLLGDLTPFGVIPRDLNGQAALSTVVGNASLNVDGDGSTVLRSTFTQIRSEWSEHIVPVVGLPVTGIRVKVNPALGYRVYPVSVADPLAEST